MSVASAAAVVSIGATLYSGSKSSNAASAGSDAASAQVALGYRQADMAEAMNDRYLDIYDQPERDLVAEAQKGLDPEKYAGMAVTDVGQQFDVQRDNLRRRNEAYGLRPDSGRWQGSNRAMGIAEALGKSHAANKTRLAIEDTNFNRKAGVVGLGKGMQTSAMSGMGSAVGTMGSAANTNMGIARTYGKDAAGWADFGLNMADKAGWLTPTPTGE